VKTGWVLSTNAACDVAGGLAALVQSPPSTRAHPRTCESIAYFELICGIVTVPLMWSQSSTFPDTMVTWRMAR
jgi:hypothetical protein